MLTIEPGGDGTVVMKGRGCRAGGERPGLPRQVAGTVTLDMTGLEYISSAAGRAPQDQR